MQVNKIYLVEGNVDVSNITNEYIVIYNISSNAHFMAYLTYDKPIVLCITSANISILGEVQKVKTAKLNIELILELGSNIDRDGIHKLVTISNYHEFTKDALIHDILACVNTTENKHSREILPNIYIDVYDVIQAFNVTDGGMQNALKKILMGCKKEDRADILDSVTRSNEIFNRGNI